MLDRILAHKREEVAVRRQRVPLETLRAAATGAAPVRGFERRLRAAVARGAPAVIAEIKRASPSKGVIRESFDPAALAESYAAGGATCLSVLTDQAFFQGHDEHLRVVRARVDLPLLRKDFVLDSYQVVESRALGADCVLLIVAALARDALGELYGLALAHGLDVLIEVHDALELDTALELAPTLIGINNRDLRTFRTSLDATYRLLDRIPPDVLVVTESGIGDTSQVRELRKRGVHTFLVGEAFMRAPDPGRALEALFHPTR